MELEFVCGCGCGYCAVEECWNPLWVPPAAAAPKKKSFHQVQAEREQALFDEGHSFESARAIVFGRLSDPDHVYNEMMRRGELIL